MRTCPLCAAWWAVWCARRRQTCAWSGLARGIVAGRDSRAPDRTGKGYVSLDSPRRSGRRRVRQLGALGIVLLTATACSSNDLPRFGFPTPAVQQTQRSLFLWQGSWIAALGVGVIV